MVALARSVRLPNHMTSLSGKLSLLRRVKACVSFSAFPLHQRRYIVSESPVPGFLDLTSNYLDPPYRNLVPPTATQHWCAGGFHLPLFRDSIPVATLTNYDVLGRARHLASHTERTERAEDQKILAGLEDWLSSAVFDPKSNICADKSLGEKWALLSEIDLIKEVRLLFHCLDFS